MKAPITLCSVVLLSTSCLEVSLNPNALQLVSVSSAIIDPAGGSRLLLRGRGFSSTAAHPAVSGVSLGGVDAAFLVLSDNELQVKSLPTPSGAGLDVVVRRGVQTASLPDALEAWSPAELDGARVFDAATAVTTEEPQTNYEWQRLTPEIAPNWRVRDGNTLSWLPATNKFWMVAGWNGYQDPEGFSPVPPDEVYPPLNTTDEVWSSPDGVSWSLELAHNNGQFERRHSHNTVLWNDRLWMIGGDLHQGYANHDVVSSADGLNWTVHLGPLGAAQTPPWSERVLQVSGVYNGRLWTMGGQSASPTGKLDDTIYHNDVWVTADGVQWEQVAPDAPASETRWAGCGVLDGLVEFQGEMWLVGCARERGDAVGHSMSNEVWSTTDGATWRQHTTPPWAGKIWHNVVVWDDKLWILFGFTYGDSANGWPIGNATEVWYSEDGETWRSLPADAPAPGSHAQGVAVREDFLLYAGGNYSFGFGAGEDKSAWRLLPFRGSAVRSWEARGEAALRVSAPDEEARPTLVPDAFGEGAPGVHFDGSFDVLALAEADTQANGRTVLWAARAPYLPSPYDWEEVGAPVGTVLGGPATPGALPNSSVGLSDGQLVVHTMSRELGPSGETLWTRFAAGGGLQEGPGEVRLVGVTHSDAGELQAWIDGQAFGGPDLIEYAQPTTWSQLGGSMPGPYYGPNSRFAGTLGAAIVLPYVADAATIQKIHAWAQGRFGAQ